MFVQPDRAVSSSFQFRFVCFSYNFITMAHEILRYCSPRRAVLAKNQANIQSSEINKIFLYREATSGRKESGFLFTNETLLMSLGYIVPFLTGK